MGKIKFDKTKILNLAVLILAVISFIVYALANARENSPLILTMLAIAAVIELILCAKQIPYLEYVPFLCTLVGMAVFIKLAFDEIGDVLSNINMNGLSTSWIASAVLIVLTVIVTALSTVFVKER